MVAAAPTAPRVLIIATSAKQLGDTDVATGASLEDIITPYYYFVRMGYIVHIASVRGGQVPLDQQADSFQRKVSHAAKTFLQDREAQERLLTTPSIVNIEGADYDAILIAGGQGITWDAPYNKELQRIIQDALAEERIVAAIGHGVASLVDVKRVDTQTGTVRPVIAGKQVTGITNEEERASGRDSLVPFLLESKLKQVGAIFVQGQFAGAPYAVRSENLITGQNAASSSAVAQMIVEALSRGVRLTP